MVPIDQFEPVFAKRYIEDGQTLIDVIDEIAEIYGIRFTENKCKKQLKRWGFRKYNTKGDGSPRDQTNHGASGEDSVDPDSDGQSLDISNSRPHERRNQRQALRDTLPITSATVPLSQALWIATPSIRRSLSAPLRHEAPERILHSFDKFIRVKIDLRTWVMVDKEKPIQSVLSSEAERQSIRRFESAMIGSIEADEPHQDFLEPGSKWQEGFCELANLLNGSHHGTLQVIFYVLSELINRGLEEIAAFMIQRIAELSISCQNHPDKPICQILMHLNNATIESVRGLENEIRELFAKVLDENFGDCHATFAAKINKAARLLRQDPSQTIEDHLPQLELDLNSDPLNRRPSRILCASVDILSNRSQHREVIEKALLLIQIASERDDCDEKSNYLVWGHFWAGSAHFHLNNDAEAKCHFECGLSVVRQYDARFFDDRFHSERDSMEKKLEDLRWREIPFLPFAIPRAISV